MRAEPTPSALLRRRLRAQGLTGAPLATGGDGPAAVAHRLLAIQAQDPRGARLAIRARTRGTTAAHVDAELTTGSLLITWLSRGTLHLVRREDYPLLQALTTPVLQTTVATRLHQTGVDARSAERAVGLLDGWLAGDGPLARGVLRERLAAAGVPTDGQAFVHLLVRAALDGVLVRGPVVDGEHRYARVADWMAEAAPEVASRRADRRPALAELAARFLAGHSPADDRDLARWAGLPLRDARTGLEAIAHRLHEHPSGLLELTDGGSRPRAPAPRAAQLLGAFEPPTWALVVLAGLCFAGLTEVFRPLDLVNQDDPELFRLHIYGTWICFALDAALLVVFVGRINRNLRERDARLADLRQHAAEEDHIVRMGLLASGAAHELGTPLSTLSVILGDWKRMPTLAKDADLSQEIEAMEAEVKRCKMAIVTGILLSSGEARGESASVTTMVTFLDDLVEEWRMSRVPAKLRYDNAFGDDLPVVSEAAVKQAVFNVLDNALDASPHAVDVVALREGDALVLAVSDEGPGFLPDILQHLGTPYRSSKGRQGGGLGLFLVFNVVRKLGGRVTARNRRDGGAIVTLSLPLSALAIDWGRPHGE